METHIDSRLDTDLKDLVQPSGQLAEKLWKEGRRESSHEAILADMLVVYRQNCDLRENVNKLLQLIHHKDDEISQLRSIGRSVNSEEDKATPKLLLENEQLKAANENIIRRYNEMDNMVMELEERCRAMGKINNSLEERLQQLKFDRHYDEPASSEDRPLPEIELSRLPYFHGKIGRREAESMLELKSEGDFLIRNCDMSLTDYTLSVRARDGVRHFLARSTESKVFLGVNSFAGWVHLVEFHRHKSLLNTNYRRLTLLNPVNKS